MMGKKSVPQLRFPEFEGEWKIDKIGKYIDLISGYSFKGNEIVEDSTGVCILRGINITEGYIRHSIEIDRFYIGDTSKLVKYILETGDIVLGMDGSKVGRNVALIGKEDKGSILVQRVARIRGLENADIKFIYTQIFSSKFHKYVDVVNTSSGIPHISAKQIRDYIIGFPTLPEQQKIASFFTAIDKKIALLKQKHEQLEQYKKGVMQKIFAQEIRFKDDDGNNYPDWVEMKLGEVSDYKNGGSFEKLVVESGSYNLITLNSIDINGKLKLTHKKVAETDNSLKIDDLVMVLSDVAHGNFLGLTDIIPDNSYVLNQRMGALKPKIEINRYYLKTFINFNQMYFKLMGQGSSQQNLSKSDILKFTVQVPNKEEQTKIAKFLSSIDKKIEKVQLQIEKAEEWKKGLLGRMFC